MLFNQPLGDGKSQAWAFPDPLGGRPNLPELVKNNLLVFEADSYAGVGDRNANKPFFVAADVHAYQPSTGSKLDGIPEQAIKDLAQANAVSIHQQVISPIV